MKAVRTVIDLNGILYLKMRSVGSYSTSGREEEGNKEGKYGVRKNDRYRAILVYVYVYIYIYLYIYIYIYIYILYNLIINII